MTLLRAATFAAPDARAAAARFERWMNYAVVEEGRVTAALAQSWGAPASEDAAFVVCRPASGAEVFVRFVEGPAVAGYVPMRTLGWQALEICVQDVLAVDAALAGSPFAVIGPPAQTPGLPTIFPMQVRGPDGEIIYLTEILNKAPDSGLPTARSLIDRPFILVLACRDLEAASAWFRRQLDVAVGAPIRIPYELINLAFGLPADQLQSLATAKWRGEVCLEFDQYPDEATTRPIAPGHLPPGLSICTVAHPGFAGLPGDWISPPSIQAGAIYGGARVGVLRTPEGALIEVVERLP